MKIAITAESTIDLPQEMLEEYRIKTVPFTVIMGGEEFADGTIDPQRLFDYTKENKKLPKTAAVNQFQYEEFFREVLKDADHIIHFSLSSAISCAYKNAESASKEEEFLGKVDVIDTKTLSTGIALQAIYASELANAGYSPEEIVTKVLERRSNKSKYRRYFSKSNDAAMITTLGISAELADYIKKENGIDMNNPKVARQIMEGYNLMGVVIIDEASEADKFLWDTGEGYYESISFNNLERENSGGEYKKALNLMQKMYR